MALCMCPLWTWVVHWRRQQQEQQQEEEALVVHLLLPFLLVFPILLRVLWWLLLYHLPFLSMDLALVQQAWGFRRPLVPDWFLLVRQWQQLSRLLLHRKLLLLWASAGRTFLCQSGSSLLSFQVACVMPSEQVVVTMVIPLRGR